ncbi:SDR family NAD(P)-dependent oxidoreductase [Paracoccus tegillarcae]|uniref:SDR family NAD(P)-dependent oxidoreductase n=1 Tax=Paracoccus tegillarcae TaxID=1529068 RepID=UPI0024111A8E|nr:SDR family NAD(P)-dependent oxidoreductase [Paracoccus tegillarcae]
MNRFAGKTVVVTGGNKGIGLAIARRFADEGANLVIASFEPQVEEAAAGLRGDGLKAIGVICDVTDAAAVKALYDAAEQEFGGVDISVQNAGIITIAKVEDLTETQWDDTMEVNTKGVFLCCQEAIRRMRASGRGGRVINMASGQAGMGSSIRRITPHRNSASWA